MKSFRYGGCIPALLLGSILMLSGLTAFAGSDVWTNSISSFWRIGTNWSAGVPPSSSFDPTTITSAGTKTVTIDSATPAVNLSIQSLSVSAPSGATNTLLLSDIPSGSRFVTTRTVTLGNGSLLWITNSTFQPQSTVNISGGNVIIDSGSLLPLSTFDLSSGKMTINGGALDTTPSEVGVRVGRTSGATGTVVLNGGTLACFGIRIGDLGGSQGNCTINGGTLYSTSVVDMGELVNSPGSLTIVSGKLIATNDITRVGNLGNGQFTQSGGTSELSFWSIADNAPGTATISGGKVTVTPGSLLDVTRVGNFGTGQLNISGGTVWLRGELHVSDNPGIIGSVFLTGGSLFATNDLVAIGRYGIGDMTITNASAYFTNASVGRHTDATGTLNIQNGGSLFCVDALSIGRFVGGTGHVAVSGGLLSLPRDEIWCGREGIGDLTVSGGTVQARALFVGMSEFGTNAPQGTATFIGGLTVLSSNLIVGTSLVSTGQVSLAGGFLAITNAAGMGTLNIVNGSFSLQQGTAAADNVVVTNTTGSFSFTGGTLQARNITVANGSPFIVGDGVNPATLLLGGGTYSFADGLVIAANATVMGCGTIIGTISNSGTLNTNCGGGLVISSITRQGTTASISFPTANGNSYLLQFKDALTDPVWTPIPPPLPGNGSVLTALDSSATNASRFYRIQVQ